MTDEKFVHLHNHTYYSLFDGLSSPKQMAEEAKQKGFKSLAITDHGSCGGWFNFQKACKEEGIKPILGYEAYISDNLKSRDKNQKICHLTLLAKNRQGLENIMHLGTIAETQGKYKKPRIDFNLLSKFHDGIICSSGCPAGELGHAISDNDDNKSKEIITKYRDLFGDDYYLEVMTHSYHDNNKDWEATEKRIARKVYQFSKKLDIKAICTNDAHYA